MEGSWRATTVLCGWQLPDGLGVVAAARLADAVWLHTSEAARTANAAAGRVTMSLERERMALENEWMELQLKVKEIGCGGSVDGHFNGPLSGAATPAKPLINEPSPNLYTSSGSSD
ncbi:hypothetical protein EJB05_45643, partial [Eragrostis curvula]